MEQQLSLAEADGPVPSREQDAVRILLLIDDACDPVKGAELGDPRLTEAVGVVRTQVRLQKLDSG
ncbi:hypothetical protein ACFV3E_40960 [Streptomyces sp. NPDC059718]